MSALMFSILLLEARWEILLNTVVFAMMVMDSRAYPVPLELGDSFGAEFLTSYVESCCGSWALLESKTDSLRPITALLIRQASISKFLTVDHKLITDLGITFFSSLLACVQGCTLITKCCKEKEQSLVNGSLTVTAAQRAGMWWDGLVTAGLMLKFYTLVPAGSLGSLLFNLGPHLFWHRWERMLLVERLWLCSFLSELASTFAMCTCFALLRLSHAILTWIAGFVL